MNNIKSEWQQNPSFRKHKKQRFWQIFLPLGLGLAVIIAVAVLIILTAVGSSGAGKVSTWADTSLIWLILPALVFAFIAVVILFLLIYFVGRVTKILPPYTAIVQHYSRLIAVKSRSFSDKLVEPLIATKSINARVRAFFRALSSRAKK